ncbi:MAG: hypothetical protein WC508_00315 [Patescibacteria group bacterium]
MNIGAPITKWTIFELACANGIVGWTMEAAAMLNALLYKGSGQEVKGILGYPPRFLVAVGEFNLEQVRTALNLGESTPLPFTVSVFDGEKDALEAHLQTQQPSAAAGMVMVVPDPMAMEVGPNTSAEDVLSAISTHGG